MNPRHLVVENVKDDNVVRETPPAVSLGSRGRWSRLLGRIAAFWPETVVLVIALLLWVPRFLGPIDLRWDAGVYYLLGTSLVTGDGYRIGSEPGSPQDIQYPPLLPAIVALHQLASGTTDVAIVAPRLRLTYALLFLVYALAAVTLAKRHLPPGLAAAAAIIAVLSPYIVTMSDKLFAELPFAVISVLFALVAGERSGGLPGRMRETFSFLLGALGFLLRTVGVALLAAWVLEAMMRRRWKVVFVRGTLALVPVLAWQVYIGHVRAGAEYSHPAYEYQRASYHYNNVSYVENMLLRDPFRPELGKVNPSALVWRVIANFSNVPGAVATVVSSKDKDCEGTIKDIQGVLFKRSIHPMFFARLLYLPLAAFTFVGLLVFYLRREWLMIFIPLVTMALVCTTPWPEQFARYLAPLVPFLAIATVLGFFEVTMRFFGHGFKKLAFLAAVTSASLLLFAISVQVKTVLWSFSEAARQRVTFVRGGIDRESRWFSWERTWQSWEKAIAWIDSHGLNNAIIATTEPHFYYLQTGRPAVMPPMEADPVQERRLLASVPISYVIIDELEFTDIARRYVLPAVDSDEGGWHLVYLIDGTKVYARTTPPLGSPSDAGSGAKRL